MCANLKYTYSFVQFKFTVYGHKKANIHTHVSCNAVPLVSGLLRLTPTSTWCPFTYFASSVPHLASPASYSSYNRAERMLVLNTSTYEWRTNKTTPVCWQKGLGYYLWITISPPPPTSFLGTHFCSNYHYYCARAISIIINLGLWIMSELLIYISIVKPALETLPFQARSKVRDLDLILSLARPLWPANARLTESCLQYQKWSPHKGRRAFFMPVCATRCRNDPLSANHSCTTAGLSTASDNSLHVQWVINRSYTEWKN